MRFQLSSNTMMGLGVLALIIVLSLAAYYLRKWAENRFGGPSASGETDGKLPIEVPVEGAATSTGADAAKGDAGAGANGEAGAEEEPEDTGYGHYAGLINNSLQMDGEDKAPEGVPGGFPITTCTAADFSDFIKSHNTIYQSAPEHKALAMHSDCNEIYYFINQKDAETAASRAYKACDKRTPGRCGVYSVNGTVYSK